MTYCGTATEPFTNESWIAGVTGLLPALFVLGCLWRYRGSDGCLEAIKVFLVLMLALSFPVTCFWFASASSEGGRVCSLHSLQASGMDSLGASSLYTGLGTSGIDRIPLEAPWDRLDFQDQQAIEAYCTDLERIMAMRIPQAYEHTLCEWTCMCPREAWFAAKFGDANADPMQAFRQPPTAGVVHPQRAAGRNGSGSSISAGLGSEILQRHASLLDGRFVRSAAAPPREAAGAGAFSRNLASAAGPSRYVSSQAPSPRIARQDQL
eukprot:g19383.t1